EKDIAAFEAADKVSPPPQGEIVFVGSSTIRRWDLASSFPDLKAINRGFGGSEMADATRYVDRIVIPYSPRLVVVYSGDNDIGATTSEQIAISFERFVRAVHARLPQTRIVVIGIKPSPLRWAQIDRMRMANAMIRAFCERDDRVAFVDVDQPMLGWDEKPRRELYVEDGLHLTPPGYQVLATLLRPFLTAPHTSAGRPASN
ncbi:MAG: GDSL-type esterase/lipase family protein, partial [Vicinamibacterales bacterium]